MFGERATSIPCPACGTRLTIPITTVTGPGRREATSTLHTDGVRLHIALTHGGDS